MLEYVFFDERPARRFVSYLKEQNVPATLANEQQGYLVSIPEATDDRLMAGIEAYYDEMLEMNEALFMASEEAEQERHLAGVTVQLSDGRSVQAQVDPALLNRLLQVISTDELGELVSAVADAVEHPDSRSLCRR